VLKLPDSVKAAWAALSWKKNATAGWKTKADSPGFVSDYVKEKNPEEDFCEHFAAYVWHPEKLKADIPVKHAQMR
jgi:hypothetical protein